MPRPILAEAKIHPAIRDTITNNHADIVKEVQAAVEANSVVIVGMAQNPAPKRARQLLDCCARFTGDRRGTWRRPGRGRRRRSAVFCHRRPAAGARTRQEALRIRQE